MAISKLLMTAGMGATAIVLVVIFFGRLTRATDKILVVFTVIAVLLIIAGMVATIFEKEPDQSANQPIGPMIKMSAQEKGQSPPTIGGLFVRAVG
ncbi:MAG: hypothetical protein U9M92_00565 [Patescibacteria group bacterium]|nr:hypothetical protein [Patescibacteria group bacterium]